MGGALTSPMQLPLPFIEEGLIAVAGSFGALRQPRDDRTAVGDRQLPCHNFPTTVGHPFPQLRIGKPAHPILSTTFFSVFSERQ
jgi:hypothetical protein